MINYFLLCVSIKMAQKKYNLVLKGMLKISVSAMKTTDSKSTTAFNQSYINEDGTAERIKYLKVVPEDDVNTVTCIEDIKMIVSANQIQSTYHYVDDKDGDEKDLVIDKTVVQKLYPKSDNIKVKAVIGMNEISPREYSGDHYFLNVQTDKNKKILASDSKVYGILADELFATSKALFCEFILSKPKPCVIYAEDSGTGDVRLVMSVLIASTHQRSRISQEIPLVEGGTAKAKKLLSIFPNKIEKDWKIDRYEQDIQKMIENMISGKKQKVILKEKSETDDLLDMIDNL